MEHCSMTKCKWLTALLVVILSVYFMSGVIQGLRRQIYTMASQYASGTHSMAFVTVPNEELGKKLARGLVEKKLAACVNIIPGIKSIYEWEGKIEEDGELLLMIKTRTSRVSEVAQYVRENHSYDVAEVISTPIDNGNPPYLEWISKNVPESTQNKLN